MLILCLLWTSLSVPCKCLSESLSIVQCVSLTCTCCYRHLHKDMLCGLVLSVHRVYIANWKVVGTKSRLTNVKVLNFDATLAISVLHSGSSQVV